MMTSDRRTFIKNMGRGMAVTSLAATGLARCTSPSDAGSESLFVTDRNHPEPAAMGYDRLPLAWYKQTVQRLKDKLPGVDAILLESDKNKVYFTGCFRGSGERTTWVFFPTQEQVDLFEWLLQGLKEKEMEGKTLGADWTLSAQQGATAKKILPQTTFVDISQECVGRSYPH